MQMTREEWLAFASHGTRTGKLATVRANGAPHVAPVWFLVDTAGEADRLVLTTGADTVKGKALRRDPRFALCVDSEDPPFSFVTFEAKAEISEDLDLMLDWATRLAARYMGPEQAERFGRRNAVPGELLILAPITRATAIKAVSD